MGISQYRLALAIGVPESRFFGLSDGFWLRMQASHDLKLAKHTLEGVLTTIQPLQLSAQ